MTYPEIKRIDAVATYLILGNLKLTARTLGIPVQTLRIWRHQPWWKELEIEVQTESDQQLDQKLASRIDKALELVNDRLENGDFQYDPRTGQFIRRPVNIRDGWRVANEMIDKRWLIRKQPHEQTSQEAVGDILKNLAKEFADMAKKRLTEKVVEGEVITIEPLEESKYAETTNPIQNETSGATVQRTCETEVLNVCTEQEQTELSEGIRQLPGDAGTDSQSKYEEPSQS